MILETGKGGFSPSSTDRITFSSDRSRCVMCRACKYRTPARQKDRASGRRMTATASASFASPQSAPSFTAYRRRYPQRALPQVSDAPCRESKI